MSEEKAEIREGEYRAWYNRKVKVIGPGSAPSCWRVQFSDGSERDVWNFHLGETWAECRERRRQERDLSKQVKFEESEVASRLAHVRAGLKEQDLTLNGKARLARTTRGDRVHLNLSMSKKDFHALMDILAASSEDSLPEALSQLLDG